MARFLEHIKDRTAKYKKGTRYYLSAWADALQGRDLRKVEPREVLRLLAPWDTAEQKRIAALKAFCSFLVKTQAEHHNFKKKRLNQIERRLHGYKGEWVALSVTLARHWFVLGLKPEDALILLALLSFKRDERPPFPSIGTLAKVINKSHPTLYRHLNHLEGAGFLKRHRRPNKSNEYDRSGLSEKLLEYESAPDTSEDVQGQVPERPRAMPEPAPLTTNPARRVALKPSSAALRWSRATRPRGKRTQFRRGVPVMTSLPGGSPSSLASPTTSPCQVLRRPPSHHRRPPLHQGSKRSAYGEASAGLELAPVLRTGTETCSKP